MSTVDQIFKEAEQLPEDQKLTLANRILASREPAATEETKREWDLAIRERIKRYDDGKARSRPAGDVFSDLDQKISK
jgi:hypothetical protein